MAFSYMATIGIMQNTDNVKVVYNNTNYKLTLDVDEFLNATDNYLSYYEMVRYISEKKCITEITL